MVLKIFAKDLQDERSSKAFRRCDASYELTETVSEAIIVARDAVKESSNCKEMQECSVSRKNIDAAALAIF
jgi:hypothetical protein